MAKAMNFSGNGVTTAKDGGRSLEGQLQGCIQELAQSSRKNDCTTSWQFHYERDCKLLLSQETANIQRSCHAQPLQQGVMKCLTICHHLTQVNLSSYFNILVINLFY